jgi:alkylation response protein AidB-like acyl-CoA dehydrogenase
MDLHLSSEQQQLVDAFAALYAKQASPERVRAAEPLGFDAALWAQVHDMGVVAMAVAESAGGWGASAVDLALIAEQQGRYVAPVPIIEAQVAARLLARLGGEPSSRALERVLSGERIVTFGVRPVRRGQAALVPAAAVADDAIVLDGERLVLVPLDGTRTGVENLGSMPVADVDVDVDVDVGGATEVLATGRDAADAFETAVDDFLLLTSAALVGIGARALELGVEYVKERKAWGIPVGAFQSVAHRLADSAAAIDGARLLAYEAAWAFEAQPRRAAELAAMAFAFAYESARDATYRALHYHGGYGFMMEYDVQLYWRRARAWANVYAEPRLVYRRVADKRYGRSGGRD